MKKFILMLLVIPLVAEAQFNKGDLFLGGSLNGTFQDNPGSANGVTKSTSNTVGVGPRIGYFINEKWVVGGNLGYTHSGSVNDAAQPSYTTHQESSSFGISAGLFTRRYFVISEKFFFAMEGGLGFSRTNTTSINSYTDLDIPSASTYSSTENPAYAVSASVRPLFVFFPSPRWSVEAGFGSLAYNYQHNLSNSLSSNTANVSVTSSTSLGIYYYFRRK